jgi:uncharacterized membrane protein
MILGITVAMVYKNALAALVITHQAFGFSSFYLCLYGRDDCGYICEI